MAVVISGNGIDMGSNPISNASQIDSTVINENNENVATTSNLVGFKNYIINGNFDIWQRGTIFTVAPGAFIYTSDRWLVWNRSNQPFTVEIANNKVFSNLGVSPRMRIVYAIAPTTGDIIISQRIEDAKRLSSKTFTGSFYHSTLEKLNISTYSAQHYGTGGGSDTYITNGSQTTTGDLSFKRYSATFNVPDFKDKTIGDYSWADFTIVAPIRTTNPLSIAQVQLEEGSVATPFENRPIGLELSLCQRYFQAIPDDVSFCLDSNVFNAYQSKNTFPLGRKYLLPVTMRVNPTTQYVNL